MKQKIFIFNPQIYSTIGKTLKDFFDSTKVPSKHSFIIDLIKSKKLSILIYGNFSSLHFNFKKKYIKKIYFFIETYIFKYMEVFFWLVINKVNPFKVKVLFNISKLQEKDIIFLFSNQNLDQELQYSRNTNFLISNNCKKIVHLSHYQFKTKIIAKNCEKIKNLNLMAENNLKKNSNYFKKYFNFYTKDFLCIPYTVRKKFTSNKSYNSRKNKCLSIGSFEVYDNKNKFTQEIREFYGTDTIHPIRKEIFDNQNSLKQYFECLNAPVIQNQNYKVRKYYEFDIVKAFNSYKMFICGEELGDLPGISFAEGMKTGSVYLGSKNDMYKDIGMKDGIHYIAHNNNLETIIDKIEFYQKNLYKLEKISENAVNFANQKFNDKYVINKFEECIRLK